MKINYHDFIKSVKTRTERSNTVDNLYISRSVIGYQNNSKMVPLFGFSADFDQEKSTLKSRYELLEHLLFLRCAHDTGIR